MPKNIDKTIKRLEYIVNIEVHDDPDAIALVNYETDNPIKWSDLAALIAAYREQGQELATKEECLQNLEARIETRRETIAAQKVEIDEIEIALQHRDNSIEGLEAEIERLRLWQDEANVHLRNAGTSLTAADALRDAVVVLLGPVPDRDRPVIVLVSERLAAFLATRTQGNDCPTVHIKKSMKGWQPSPVEGCDCDSCRTARSKENENV